MIEIDPSISDDDSNASPIDPPSELPEPPVPPELPEPPVSPELPEPPVSPEPPESPEPGSILGVLGVFDPEVDILGAIEDAMEAQVQGLPWVSQFFWDIQDLSYNCSVAVQTCILQYFGIDVSEAELTQLAIENGWLTNEGAHISDVGKLLEYYGVETHPNVNATLEELMSELAQGRAVIIPADSGELWADTFLEELWEWMEDVLGIPDHVVWVTGVDMTDPDNPQVIVNDTGDPEGMGRRYPLSEFMDAWEDANFTYIATDEAPPGYEVYVELESWLQSA